MLGKPKLQMFVLRHVAVIVSAGRPSEHQDLLCIVMPAAGWCIPQIDLINPVGGTQNNGSQDNYRYHVRVQSTVAWSRLVQPTFVKQRLHWMIAS